MIKLPGYGRSSPLSIPHSKRNVGLAILSLIHSLLPQPNTSNPIILAGHDRGAKICHRLAVDAPTDTRFDLKGAIILDIIPGVVQWQNATLQTAVGFYHWAFLPNIELATAMILAFGGDNWVRSCFTRWAGKNENGIRKMKEHDAERVYGAAFKYEHVIRASCDDYRAGAFEEVIEHEEDQREGRKMDCDVMVLYSATFLPTRGKIETWEEWMGKGKLETRGFGDGVGHFIAEEAPDETAEAIFAFYRDHK
jgi:pimeloyl-ACP methyl ester carboxylesterase